MNCKELLLDAARGYHRKTVYLPAKKKYVVGLAFEPDDLKGYQGNEWEPVVPTESLFDLGKSAFCTVNRYNALVLNSQNLLGL